MQVNYKYASPSQCTSMENTATLGFSPDLSREEKVSFLGKLKHPLLFRDAMLMLRDIVISDMSQQQKERPEYFEWLDQEIERRIKMHEKYAPKLRQDLKDKMSVCDAEIAQQNEKIKDLQAIQRQLKTQIDAYDAIIKLNGIFGSLSGIEIMIYGLCLTLLLRYIKTRFLLKPFP